MKRLISAIIIAALAASYIALPVYAEKNTETISYTYSAGNGETRTREMEKLGRGLIAIAVDDGVYLSWRLFDSEDMYTGSSDKNVTFNIYEYDTKIAEGVNTTNFTVDGGNINAVFSVEPVYSDGSTGKREGTIKNMTDNYFDIPVQKPSDAILHDGSTASYTLNDASCGDLDGDGEYEIIVKWDANGKDNSQNGYTGNVLIDAYSLDGNFLWRVDLGPNIRAGAHYTQFLVYDFDGDGKAEMTCQTAPGSKDSTGAYVTAASHVDAIKSMTTDDNTVPFVDSSGYILDGDEFLTIFDCNGKAADTIYYPNQRISPSVWGDTYGNRVDRFTATVAYMDGEKPYAVYMRGYYFGNNGQQRQAACAVSFDGSILSCSHSFDTYNPNSYKEKNSSSSYSNGVYKGVDGYKKDYEKYVGEGNHNCTVADVDGDGKDEVITGALCYEFDDENTSLTPKWCTFREHGDALHIGDYDPTHPGFEFFTVHEDGWHYTKDSTGKKYTYTADNIKTLPDGTTLELDYGMTLIDPATGKELYHKGVDKTVTGNPDTGRGVMANTGAGGYFQFSAVGTVIGYGNDIYEMTNQSYGNNFRIFWDGDLYDELLDGTARNNGPVGITSYNKSTNSYERIFTSSGCSTANDTKNNPALTADLFGDWREEIVMRKSDNSGLRVYSTTTPTNYKIKTLMQDPVYRSGVAAEQTAYNQPPHVGIYMSDATFTPAVREIELVSPPTKTTYYQGEALNTDGMLVLATYVDNSYDYISDYQILGYNKDTAGTQTVTVSYKDKSLTFEVTVLPVDISNINGDYITGSTTSVSESIPIGTLMNDFVIEHTLTVNSMPASGNTTKDSTDGFMLKFTPDGAVGAGWCLVSDNNTNMNVVWKNASYKVITNSEPLSAGTTYTFRYTFTNVADGTGAHMGFTILDEDGIEIAHEDNLDLRNMTSNNRRPATLSAPLTTIEIFNQAPMGGQASVSIGKAHICNILNVDTDSGSARIYIPSPNTRIFAAKYAEGILDAIQELTVDEDNYGKFTDVSLDFVPDKIFAWRLMTPKDLWERQ